MELTVTDLTCTRGGVPVLAGVSFSVTSGEALLLRGPNGSGKTTLLRTMAGLQPPLTGSVSLGTDEITYAAHADGIKPTLTVAENLRFWADIYDSGDISPALAAFELTHLAERPAGNLSAGQKRRLGLARLLVTARPLWLLDEPTVSLDVKSVALFADAVATHLKTGGMAVIATHIDLGFKARELDVAGFRAEVHHVSTGSFDEAFT